MMKKLLALCLMMMMACSAMGAWAEENSLANVTWEEYCSSTPMTEEQLVEFFDQAKVDGFLDAKFDDVFSKLSADQKSKTALGMIFEAKIPEADDQKQNDPFFNNYLVDFKLVSTKDVYVYLLGQYDFLPNITGLTVPLGPIKLEANTELKIMEDLIILYPNTYNNIVNDVGLFKCGAVMITEEWIDAAKDAGIDLFNFNEFFEFYLNSPSKYGTPLQDIPPFADSDTTLTLELKIYNNANEDDNFTIKKVGFTYTSEANAPVSTPKTGDSANLTLWFALCAVSLLSLLALRRKMAAR